MSKEILLSNLKDINDVLQQLDSEKSDVWSFGIVIYELICRDLPYKGQYNFNIILFDSK